MNAMRYMIMLRDRRKGRLSWWSWLNQVGSLEAEDDVRAPLEAKDMTLMAWRWEPYGKEWRKPVGAERSPADSHGGNGGFQSYNCKETDSANNMDELGRGPQASDDPQLDPSPGSHVDFSPVRFGQRTQRFGHRSLCAQTSIELWENQLWGFVTHQ